MSKNTRQRTISTAKALASITAAVAVASTPVHAFFLDGNGHYSLRGASVTNPGFSSDLGMYQAVEQSFRLEAEARMNDKSSFFSEIRFTDDPANSFLGNTAKPRKCASRRVPGDTAGEYTTDVDCEGRHQDTGNPSYAPFQPIITKAYARQAFDFCLVEAGRRPRDWGLGAMLNSGTKPFDNEWSTFDGVDCNVNIQKSQTIGFKFGYDKIAETGSAIDNPYDRQVADSASEAEFDSRSQAYGATNPSDDIDQYFFTIEVDDRKANAGSAVTKQIGIYAANMIGKESKTDIKYLDIYTAFFLSNLTSRLEVLFRSGKSADPNWIRTGGARFRDGEIVTNKVDSIGIAGNVEWTIARSGTAIGPADYRQGNTSRHLLFLDYAYAPGDDNNYYRDDPSYSESTLSTIGESKRKNRAKTMGFNRNFLPALILFNGKSGTESTGFEGIYDPSQVMNATVFGAGYRMEGLEFGTFEIKALMARLNTAMPKDVKEYFAEAEGKKPVGYHGNQLGLELDVKYSQMFANTFEYGIEGAYARGGNALKVSDRDPSASMLLQSYATFKF